MKALLISFLIVTACGQGTKENSCTTSMSLSVPRSSQEPASFEYASGSACRSFLSDQTGPFYLTGLLSQPLHTGQLIIVTVGEFTYELYPNDVSFYPPPISMGDIQQLPIENAAISATLSTPPAMTSLPDLPGSLSVTIHLDSGQILEVSRD